MAKWQRGIICLNYVRHNARISASNYQYRNIHHVLRKLVQERAASERSYSKHSTRGYFSVSNIYFVVKRSNVLYVATTWVFYRGE